MYMSDHLVLCGGLAVVTARRLRLPLVPLVTLMCVVNLIDYDHLLDLGKDDGTANSLALHPLHIYSGVSLLAAAFFGLIFPERLKWGFACMVAISSHLASDALAFACGYRVACVVGLGLAQFAVFAAIVRRCVVAGPRLGFVAFMAGVWLIDHLELAVTYYGLHADPITDAWFWAIPPSLAALICLLFWTLFSRTALEARPQPGGAGGAPPGAVEDGRQARGMRPTT